MRIDRDGVGLVYEEAGGEDPPILLVHGWGTDRTVLKPLFDFARRSHRVVSVDLRGFGESDAPRQPYTIEGYSDDLVFVADRLRLARPIVIGHSMGGIIALDFAARYARRATAAVLLEAMVVAEPLVAGLAPILEGVRAEGYRDVVAGLMTHLTGPRFDPAERARLVTVAASCAQHVLISAMEGILAFDSVAAAARIECPLLFVGTNATYTDMARFRQLCPQLETRRIAGCGHYFPLEAPERVNAMIASFIETNVRA